MMEKVYLTAKEIILLSCRYKQQEVFGIEDGFYGMDDEDIEKEIPDLISALTDKGYIEADFDGNLNLNSKIATVIDTCINFQKFISFSEKKLETESFKMNFYLKDNVILMMEKEGDGYTVLWIERNEVYPSILESLSWCSSDILTLENIVVTYDDLETAKKTNMPLKLNTSEEQLDIIQKSIEEKLCYHICIYIDYQNQENGVDSITTIENDKGAMEVTSKIIEGDYFAEFSPITKEDFLRRIKMIISAFCSNGR